MGDAIGVALLSTTSISDSNLPPTLPSWTFNIVQNEV
jgi:hypothetical protein